MLIWFSSSVVISVMPTINTVEVAGWFEIQVDNWCWKIVKNFLEYVVIITEFLFLFKHNIAINQPIVRRKCLHIKLWNSVIWILRYLFLSLDLHIMVMGRDKGMSKPLSQWVCYWNNNCWSCVFINVRLKPINVWKIDIEPNVITIIWKDRNCVHY